MLRVNIVWAFIGGNWLLKTLFVADYDFSWENFRKAYNCQNPLKTPFECFEIETPGPF